MAKKKKSSKAVKPAKPAPGRIPGETLKDSSSPGTDLPQSNPDRLINLDSHDRCPFSPTLIELSPADEADTARLGAPDVPVQPASCTTPSTPMTGDSKLRAKTRHLAENLEAIKAQHEMAVKMIQEQTSKISTDARTANELQKKHNPKTESGVPCNPKVPLNKAQGTVKGTQVNWSDIA
jgi:hypothetical protein